MDTKKLILKCLPMIAIMVVVQFLAIQMIIPYSQAVNSGVLPQTFSDSNSILDSVQFLISVLAVTAVMLLIIKLKLGWLIKIIIHLILLVNLIVLASVLLSSYYPNASDYFQYGIIALCILVITVLYVYPEWYLINLVGICVTASFGYSIGGFMSVKIAILLLLLFSVYDFIAVFLSKHMIALASMALEQKLPLLFIIPPSLSFSYVKQKIDMETRSGAQLIGFGDAVFPAVLAVAVKISYGINMFYGVVLGTVIGCIILEYVLIRFNRPLPALPFLCPCAIVGFGFAHVLIG
jgi:presenilin-like A22 family membrane protease